MLLSDAVRQAFQDHAKFLLPGLMAIAVPRSAANNVGGPVILRTGEGSGSLDFVRDFGSRLKRRLSASTSTAFSWRLTSLRVRDFIDFLHSCHAERKRGAGRGGVEAPSVCLGCHNRRHIFDSGVVKKLAKPPAPPSCVGSFDSVRLRLSALRMIVGKKSHTLKMTALGRD